MGAVAKSYMRKAFLIYEEMSKYLVIYEEAVSHLWNRSLLDFLIYEENFVFFFISVQYSCRIPVRHFFSQSRRLLTKIFESEATVNEKCRCCEFRGKGNKQGLLCSLSAFPSFIKPGTRQTGLTGRFQKSFDMNNWHSLRKGEKIVTEEKAGKGFSD